MEIGYWAIRGLGAPLRMMATYGGLEYKDSQYSSGEAWFKEHKPRILGMNPLANLPYVVDGDKCICQSNATMVHIGEKIGIYEGLRDLELLVEIFDLRNAVVDLAYPFRKVARDQAEFEVAAEAHLGKVAPKQYAKLEAVLEKNGTLYMLKDTPSVCDFHVWEMLDQHESLALKFNHPSPLIPFPKLKRLHDTLKADPKLKPYFDSDKYKLPINNPLGGAYFH
ncbi:hypothetical protein CTAYLR_009538 [Chrysophaeum taylorii]|uniref:glutathione transferase n=1 Tax=Chrysophaeum taylorii TaxID=2483200 RepID=A0AAD7UCR8_9STRA|nr:hypothetical protein CTAYLR_009538 [Chrysophaeum taylorii]